MMGSLRRSRQEQQGLSPSRAEHNGQPTYKYRLYLPFHYLWMKNGVVDIEPMEGKQSKPISSMVNHLPASKTSFKI